MPEPVGELAHGAAQHGFIYPLLDALQELHHRGISMVEFEIGKTYFLETFGKHYVGRVASVSATEVHLVEAAWVADSGRFSEFMAKGRSEKTEVEPVGIVSIPLAYIAAKYPWPHKLFPKAF